MAQPYQNYRRVEISTADPMRIVVLLYEGAIKNLNQAIRLLGTDSETASTKISRTLDIVNYLRNALDHEKGGEISRNLERLYEYMRDTLTEAGFKRDPEKIQEVIGLLQTLLEGWRGVIGNQMAEAAPSEEEVPPALRPPVNLSMVG